MYSFHILFLRIFVKWDLWSELILYIDILQKETETPELERGAVRAVQDLYDVMRHDVLSINMRFATVSVVCIH